MAERGGTSQLRFFHGDHLGTMRQLTDASGSALLASAVDYSPFGSPLTAAGGAALSQETALQFTGQHRDSGHHATNLQWHRARWLNTDHGRWLSQDPVFDWPGNLGGKYNYSFYAPNSIDISGLKTLVVMVAVAAIIGGLGAVAHDTYANGWTSLGHALTVAAIGALTAVLVTLAFAGAAGALAYGATATGAAGFGMLESSLVLGVLLSPFAIVSAGVDFQREPHPREKQLALLYLMLSVITITFGLAKGYAKGKYWQEIEAQRKLEWEKINNEIIRAEKQYNDGLKRMRAAQSKRTLELEDMLKQAADPNLGTNVNQGVRNPKQLFWDIRGTATTKEADRMGKAWLGPGFRRHKKDKDGYKFVSADGLRQYRRPRYKPNTKKILANFESRPEPKGEYLTNAHLEIVE